MQASNDAPDARHIVASFITTAFVIIALGIAISVALVGAVLLIAGQAQAGEPVVVAAALERVSGLRGDAPWPW